LRQADRTAVDIDDHAEHQVGPAILGMAAAALEVGPAILGLAAWGAEGKSEVNHRWWIDAGGATTEYWILRSLAAIQTAGET
jgi:hypothetical protein